MAESQTSKDLKAIMDLGFIIERAEAQGSVTLRGRRPGHGTLSVTSKDDASAASALRQSAETIGRPALAPDHETAARERLRKRGG